MKINKNTIILINLSCTSMPVKFVSADDDITVCPRKYANVHVGLQRWKFLSAANKFCGRFSWLYNLQRHTVSELKIKFGDTDSVCRMKQLVHVYFDRLLE